MTDKDRERIKRENAETLAKFRAGESLAVVNHVATWWPPRPIIKKDQEAIKRLYE